MRKIARGEWTGWHENETLNMDMLGCKGPTKPRKKVLYHSVRLKQSYGNVMSEWI